MLHQMSQKKTLASGQPHQLSRALWPTTGALRNAKACRMRHWVPPVHALISAHEQLEPLSDTKTVRMREALAAVDRSPLPSAGSAAHASSQNR